MAMVFVTTGISIGILYWNLERLLRDQMSSQILSVAEFVAEWTPDREWAFLVSYSQFVPGSFIRDTGPAETIHFFAVEAVFQF